MFIGYEVKSNQNQAKPMVLESDIKLSQAVLDPSSVKGKNKEPVCLVAEYNKKQFILAALDPTQAWQCSLDLMFSAGSQLKLFVRGSGTIHVTGFEQIDDFDDDLEMSSMSESDMEETDVSATAGPKVKALKKETAIKQGSAKKAITNGNSKAKKTNGKAPPSGGDDANDDSDDSDDDDYLNFDESEDDVSDDDDDDIDEEMDEDDDELGELDDDDESSDEE